MVCGRRDAPATFQKEPAAQLGAAPTVAGFPGPAPSGRPQLQGAAILEATSFQLVTERQECKVTGSYFIFKYFFK